VAFKEMRTLNLLYVHHANAVGFVFVLMYLIYFSTSAPNSTSAYLNDLLCKITEFVWGIIKYLRSYSVLLIALYRLAAVNFIETFKLVNRSYLSITLPIIVCWIVSIALFLATKYGFNTTYGSLYCIDGYSMNMTDVVDYLIVSSLMAILVPFTLITVIYIFIKKILSKNGSKLLKKKMTASKMSQSDGSSLADSERVLRRSQVGQTQQRPSAEAMSVSTAVSGKSVTKRNELKKNVRFNLQLISLNVCYIMCFAMSFILSFRYVIPDFNVKFYYFRQLLRILNVFFQATIPVVSLVFNPNISIKKIKSHFKNMTIRRHRHQSSVSARN
jgi:hypothetical protein